MILFKPCYIFILFTMPLVYGFAGGNGTPSEPYQISNADQLEMINNDLDACYTLTGNIDLTGRVYSKAVIAFDISSDDGFQGEAFNGILDGAGFEITMPNISDPNSDFIGLFGSVGGGGNIWNIGLKGGTFKGGEYVGGFAGVNFGFISESFSLCSIEAGYYGGGITGLNFGIIYKSFALGNVSGGAIVGGLTGLNDGYTLYEGNISNCYSTGNVKGESDVGGFVGNNFAVIEHCYCTGEVSGTQNVANPVYAGGFTGWQSEYYGGIYDSFWDKDTSNQNESAGGAVGQISTNMTAPDIFKNVGWDYVVDSDDGSEDVWYQQTNAYPKLHWQYRDDMIATGDINYDGTVNQDDVLTFASQWLRYQTTPRFIESDLNQDGFVNIYDFAEFASKWANP